MKWKTFGIIPLILGIVFSAVAQTTEDLIIGNVADTAVVNSLLEESKEQLSVDPDKAIDLAQQAKELAEEINFLKGKAFALKNVGLGYYYKGDYPESLQYWDASLKIFEAINDPTGTSNMLNNIAAVYSQQGDEKRGLEFSLKSLKIAEKLGDKLRILSSLNTIGTIYYNKPATRDKALDYLLRALPLCEEINNNEALGTIAENIGEIYFSKKDFVKAREYFDKSIKALGNSANSAFAYNGIGKIYLAKNNYDLALNYHNKALRISEEFNSKPNMIRTLESMANVYIAKEQFQTAINYFNKAKAIAEEIKAAQDLKDIYRNLSEAYVHVGDYRNGYKFKTLYADIKDTLYNIETDKKLGTLQFEFDLEKKQSEINLLTKDKELTALELKRQKFAKNASMVGFGLVFLIAVLIFVNYRAKVKTHKILDRQKGEIEGLLLNILPSEVAKELRVNGHAQPRYYESVSVMFTDFKGFTIMADKVSPQLLVEQLNECFMAFDEIIGRYQLEKIKTIGDSYMCAGGIPTPDDSHIDNMVKASLEIKDFMVRYNAKRKMKGLEPWDLRIGIHIGPVVAGVVGKKKYAYDIWGSTVNVASRMESSGMPGKVNISSSFYALIKDRYKCTYRGKINAKNVGDIDMYFLEEELLEPVKDASQIAVAKTLPEQVLEK